MSRTRSILFLALLVGLLSAGCRTYGGYGSEEATYNQIERVIHQFEEDMSRAASDLEALEAASADSPFLEMVAAEYHRILQHHEAAIAGQQALFAQLSPGSSHRDLHRAYGAMVITRSSFGRHYQELLQFAVEAYAPDTSIVHVTDRPYAIVPPFYARIGSSQSHVTVNELLEAARSGGTPSVEAQMALASSIPPASDEDNHSDGPARHGASERDSGGATH